jgi:hypothetical protein
VVGFSKHGIRRRLYKRPLLLKEPLGIQAPFVIKAHDEVHPTNHANRSAVLQLNVDVSHPHPLADHCRHGVMLRVAQQLIEDVVPHPVQRAIVVNDEIAVAVSHGSAATLSLPGLACR